MEYAFVHAAEARVFWYRRGKKVKFEGCVFGERDFEEG